MRIFYGGRLFIRLIATLFFVGCGNQQIVETDDLEVVKSLCDGADSQTLVIFDMDNVLTESVERAFQADLYPQVKDVVDKFRKRMKKLPLSEQEKLWAGQCFCCTQIIS